MSLPGLERNAVIAASAGTGKTQLLTGIYLAFTLGLAEDRRQVPTDRIVATTFSRAAAAEIRERLESRLLVLADLTKQESDSLQGSNSGNIWAGFWACPLRSEECNRKADSPVYQFV